jgi:galactose oxidase
MDNVSEPTLAMTGDTPTHRCCAAPEDRAKIEGKWGPVFYLPNVAIHVHLLPNGKLLFWGRRDRPDGSMNEHECTPHLWDPRTGEFDETPQPTLDDHDRTKVNLFCSGHAFMPDGRLLVAGGHLEDSHGDNQACIYDYRTNNWSPLPLMNNGRWYPNVIALADGTMLVTSGSYFDGVRHTPQNNVPQIFDGEAWHSMRAPAAIEDNPDVLSLYPRTHLLADGRVVFTGMNASSLFFDPTGAGSWTRAPDRALKLRDYCPSVMYDTGKVIFIGGGNDQGTGLPTNQVEVIDYNDRSPEWRRTQPMNFRRRHHNGVLLPDGKVLVVGGTQGAGFNDIDPGKPVHAAELWDPANESWTVLASEGVDRCYHATAILLPDGSVLSAGSGEGGSEPNVAHREAQIFFPPYLFRGVRPIIAKGPDHVDHGEAFALEVVADDVAKISLIRLPSVTHAFDQNQRINFLAFKADSDVLTVTAPPGPEICPPGHYMLFVVNKLGVPSVAHVIHVGAFAPTRKKAGAAAALTANLGVRQAEIKKTKPGTRVTVGLTSTCPYGLGACWGGAYEALKKLSGVVAVEPIANGEDGTASVYIEGELTDPDLWRREFATTANGSYDFRGIELTLNGTVRASQDRLELTTASGLIVRMEPLSSGRLLQWDKGARRPKPAAPQDMQAYDQLRQRVLDNGGALEHVRSLGLIERTGDEWIQKVRAFSLHS